MATILESLRWKEAITPGPVCQDAEASLGFSFTIPENDGVVRVKKQQRATTEPSHSWLLILKFPNQSFYLPEE